MPGADRRSARARQGAGADLAELPGDELRRLIQTLEEEMHEAAAELRFEYAARLRDEIKDLQAGAAGGRVTASHTNIRSGIAPGR